VRKDSGGKQIPWESTSLEGDFVFVPLPPTPAVVANLASIASIGKIDSIPVPQLKVGDMWEYQQIDLLSGSVTEKFTRRVTAITADETRFGGYVADRSLGLLRRTREGKVVLTWKPKHPQYDFPLQVGKAWSAVGVVDTERLTAEHNFNFKVVRQEQVLVPAGVFDTLRLEGTSKYKSTMKKDGASGQGNSTYRIWFSPVTGYFVAYEYEETNFKGIVHKKERSELLSYKRDAVK
jgi:hypothetical protein